LIRYRSLILHHILMRSLALSLSLSLSLSSGPARFPRPTDRLTDSPHRHRYALHRAVSLTFTAFEPGKEADEKRPTMQAIYHAEVELAGKSIGELLLASGLAKVVDWTIPKDKQELYRKLEVSFFFFFFFFFFPPR